MTWVSEIVIEHLLFTVSCGFSQGLILRTILLAKYIKYISNVYDKHNFALCGDDTTFYITDIDNRFYIIPQNVSLKTVELLIVNELSLNIDKTSCLIVTVREA